MIEGGSTFKVLNKLLSRGMFVCDVRACVFMGGKGACMWGGGLCGGEGMCMRGRGMLGEGMCMRGRGMLGEGMCMCGRGRSMYVGGGLCVGGGYVYMWEGQVGGGHVYVWEGKGHVCGGKRCVCAGGERPMKVGTALQIGELLLNEVRRW